MFGVASFFTGKWLHQWEIERAYDRAEAKWRGETSRDGQFSIAMDDTIVTVEARAFKAQYRWENFTKVEEMAGLVWLWMPRLRALVVSQRAFPDPGAAPPFLPSPAPKSSPARRNDLSRSSRNPCPQTGRRGDYSLRPGDAFTSH